MKFILEVNNKTTYKFSKKKFMGVFAYSLKIAKMNCLEGQTLELSIALVSEKEMHELNNQYRKKDSVTDVLSFCEYASTKELCAQVDENKAQQTFIGELILCPKYIEQNVDKGESMEHAMTYITAHGILHLLGFEHGKKMFALQAAAADDLVV